MSHSPTHMGPKCEVWRRCNENCGRRKILKFYLLVYHIRKKWGVQIARHTQFFGISQKKNRSLVHTLRGTILQIGVNRMKTVHFEFHNFMNGP